MAYQVTLPFRPRPMQLPFLKAMMGGCKRASIEWHRRFGKDLTCLNMLTQAALSRVGSYFYFFPTYGQAKRAIWEGADYDGNRFLEYYIPRVLVKRKNETELMLEFKNGSILRLLGLDKWTKDTIVGANPIGCVFSEYAIQDPAGWRYMSPILLQNDGWAVFNFTPRGSNHATEQHDRFKESMLAGDSRYFAQTLNIEDTGVVTEAMLDDERRSGMPEEVIQQEYYCSRTAMLAGAYFGPYLERARKDGRITTVPFDNRLPVHTAWDLGVNDPTAIWLFQLDLGGAIRFIRYYEEGKHTGSPGLAAHLAALREFQREHGYVYGTHLAPHDLGVVEWGSGVSRAETAAGMGWEFTIVANGKRIHKDDQIEATKNLFGRFVFDEVTCGPGLKCLQHYQADYDEPNRVYKSTPKHDWASHGADALQTLACGIEQVSNDLYERDAPRQQIRAITEFDPFEENYGSRSVGDIRGYPGFSSSGSRFL